MFDHFSYIHILFVLVIAGYYFIIAFGKNGGMLKRVLKWSIYGVCALALGFCLHVYMEWKETYADMAKMMKVVQYNKSIDEKLVNGVSPEKILQDLQDSKITLEKMSVNISYWNNFLGHSRKKDSLIVKFQKLLDGQILRVRNMNVRSVESVNPTLYRLSSEELRYIEPVSTGQEYINVGMFVDEAATFQKNNTVLVRVVRTDNDSVMYQQAFVAKGGINAFVIPNYFTDDHVQLQMGYVDKTEKQTYHYIESIPYAAE